MTPDLPAVIAELKRLRFEWETAPDYSRERDWKKSRFQSAALRHADALIAAAEECSKYQAALSDIAGWKLPRLTLNGQANAAYEMLRTARKALNLDEP